MTNQQRLDTDKTIISQVMNNIAQAFGGINGLYVDQVSTVLSQLINTQGAKLIENAYKAGWDAKSKKIDSHYKPGFSGEQDLSTQAYLKDEGFKP